jgi:dolichyl-phosphate-mannose--protein O-mannosyl transferase
MVAVETRTANSTTEDRITVLGQPWAIWCVIAALLAVVGVLLFQKIGSRLFYSLVATEMKSKAPPILAYNIFGYCLGPSLLAIIPIAGPVLSVIWIVIILSIGGATRLKISVRGAVTASMVAVAAMVGLATATWFVSGFIPPSTIDKQPPIRSGRR